MSLLYSAAELADLYYRRWNVELFFRDLKTTMGWISCVAARRPAYTMKFGCIGSYTTLCGFSCGKPPKPGLTRAAISALRQLFRHCVNGDRRRWPTPR
ncbi:transposase [Salinisphaera sp. LB1]|uniref:transposase n=1 Tax=Salinisphaera sp. LB1 TaxID=2183911 RepID=UPI00131471F9